jgi:hypothetical protein
MEKLKSYLFIENKIAEAKARGEKKLSLSIWNMYRYEYVRIMAERDGYEVSLKKRDNDDTHHFEVKL